MKTTTRETNITLGTTVVQIVKNNPNRVALVIMNRSDTAVDISTDNKVTTALGVRLTAEVGSVSFSKRDFGELPSREWFGVSSAITKVVTVLETIILENDVL